MQSDHRPSDTPRLVANRDSKPIGVCSFCGHDIVAPADVLVWVDDESFHQACYQSHLARRMTDEGIRPAI